MSQESVTRRLAAILSADMAAYSRLMETDETGTVGRQKIHRVELIDPEIARHNGRIVKTTGDGLLAEFASVVDAVACAAAIQRAMAAREADVPEARRIRYRIGINLGDIIIDDDDIYGDGVNIAARLQELADPGGVCVSGTAYDQLKAKVDVGYQALGAQRVKNIAEPVRVYRLLLDPTQAGKRSGIQTGIGSRATILALTAVILLVGGGGYLTWLKLWTPDVEAVALARMAFPLPDKPSIAVLPFVNMSDDPEQEYVADGMTEDLITDLSKVSGLFVIARNSTFVYKGRSVPVRQVSEDLGIRYVLEGSVQRAGDTVRINAQLIDATTGGHVWADRYDGNVTEIFAVQDSFVREIVAALSLNLTKSEQEEIANGQTSNIEAREAFQNGWEHYLHYTAADNATAAELFKRAVELDPEYGRAYSALGMVYVRGCQWRWNAELGLSPSEAFITAVQYLAKGEEHSSAMTNVAASQIYLYEGKNDLAFTEAARALARAPNDPEAQVSMGLAMMTTGRAEAGLEFVETALRLSPSHPNHYVLARAMAYFAMNDLERAATILDTAMKRDPSAVDLAPLLAATYARLGRREEAHAALQLWKPDASQSELQTDVFAYHFPYKYSVGREFLDRLHGGLEVAALPTDVTVESLIVTLRQAEEVSERRSVIRTLGYFGPAAKAAVPILQELLDNPDLGYAVELSLRQINAN